LVTLDEVVAARGNRRVVTVGVGDVKDDPLKTISSIPCLSPVLP
jgi:hypothetical protein